MPNRRSPHPDHVHFAPGFAGTLRWMGYWATSRSTNVRRHLSRQWQSRLRPALVARTHALRDRATTPLHRANDAPVGHAYDSLADAVRHRRWAKAGG